MILLSLVMLFLGEITSSPVTTRYDTIVVGLGAAGTTAASTLAHAGRRVLALEAQDRVGGRVWTRTFGDGVVEAGAEWIHGTERSRVFELAIQNNIPLMEQELPMDVLVSHGSARNDPVWSYLLEYGLVVMDEVSDHNEPMGQFIERRIREHLQTKHPELLEPSAKPELDSFFKVMNLMVNSNEASNDWNDVTALQTFEILNGSQTTSWHRYGYKIFFDILLNTYKNGPGLATLDMKLNKEVTSIQWSASGVLVTCADGGRYSADNVIVTVSLGVLKERHSSLFSPPLPQENVNAIEIISMGVVNKIILQFDEPRPAENLVMFYWKPEDKKLVPEEDKWITELQGLTEPAGSNNTLTLWTMGENAKLVEMLPEEVIKAKVFELLKMFLGPNVPEPVAMIRTTWFSNPFTRGSYSFDNLEVPKHPGLRQALAAPVGAGGAPRVLFAGEATNHQHYATVHGASETGYREAQRLLAAVNGLSAIGAGCSNR